MKEQKYKLPFVNEGKPFTIPDWTVESHRRALTRMLKKCKNMSQDKQDTEFQYYVIYETLYKIDTDVDFKKIKNLHPENLISLFNLIYNAGKIDILFQDPPQKSRGKKSTGMKK